MLSLPSRYVYVYYEDGNSENVAMTDTLDRTEAEEYKTYWETARRKKVVTVSLEDRGRMARKSYSFNG